MSTSLQGYLLLTVEDVASERLAVKGWCRCKPTDGLRSNVSPETKVKIKDNAFYIFIATSFLYIVLP